MDDVNHFRRLCLVWLLASVIATPLVVFVLAPGLPPGNGSVQASGQVVDNAVLLGVSTPVALAVLVYFFYALVAFRERDQSAVLDGPPVRGHSGVQTTWLVVTTAIVLFLAAYGSIRMLEDGSGGGQGPNPIAKPTGAAGALQAGDRPAVEVHLSLPVLRRPGDGGPRASRPPGGRAPCHLA